MKNFKNIFNTFSVSKGQPKTSEQGIPLANVYRKADGTKVTEQFYEYGKNVMEICPDGAVIMRFYNTHDDLIQDYIRHLNIEIGRIYDLSKLITSEFMNVYDEHNKLARRTEKTYEYFDTKTKSEESIHEFPEDVKTHIKYDIYGKRIEKYIQKAAVKTYYNEDDKPFKREIDRGSGGIITENI